MTPGTAICLEICRLSESLAHFICRPAFHKSPFNVQRSSMFIVPHSLTVDRIGWPFGGSPGGQSSGAVPTPLPYCTTNRWPLKTVFFERWSLTVLGAVQGGSPGSVAIGKSLTTSIWRSLTVNYCHLTYLNVDFDFRSGIFTTTPGQRPSSLFKVSRKVQCSQAAETW